MKFISPLAELTTRLFSHLVHASLRSLQAEHMHRPFPCHILDGWPLFRFAPRTMLTAFWLIKGNIHGANGELCPSCQHHRG